MRKRRRSRGLWFPTDAVGGAAGTTLADNAVHQDATPFFDHELDAPTNADVLASSVTAVGGLLPLLEQPGYIPRRIVGRISAGIQVDNYIGTDWGGSWAYTSLTPPNIHIHFGIFVDRVDQLGVLQNLAAWNPFDDSSLQKRWLFERDWWLNSHVAYDAWKAGQFSGSFTAGVPYHPDKTEDYGYLAQSGTVDIKPKVKVGYEERLFQQWTFQWVNQGDATTGWAQNLTVETTSRFRIFGTPIRNARR